MSNKIVGDFGQDALEAFRAAYASKVLIPEELETDPYTGLPSNVVLGTSPWFQHTGLWKANDGTNKNFVPNQVLVPGSDPEEKELDRILTELLEDEDGSSDEDEDIRSSFERNSRFETTLETEIDDLIDSLEIDMEIDNFLDSLEEDNEEEEDLEDLIEALIQEEDEDEDKYLDGLIEAVLKEKEAEDLIEAPIQEEDEDQYLDDDDDDYPVRVLTQEEDEDLNNLLNPFYDSDGPMDTYDDDDSSLL